MALQRKVCNSEVKEFNEKDLSVVHFISSELPDRGGDILYAAKNDKGAGMIMLGRPVVLQQHGWGQMGMEPIAKPVWIKVARFKDRDGIECKTQFFPDDLGKRLFKKTTEGYMPNWSVGWMPIEGHVEIRADIDGKELRHVYEWELLEYSIVGVPMQPDAQTAEMPAFLFKMIPEEEDRFGELVGWKKDDGSWEEKPYPNEHACRLEDPDKYIRIRRQNDKFGKGIHAIWGVQGGGKPVELQAIRFSKSKFTAAEARAWLKDHKYKCKMFEPSSEKCEKCGKPMLIKWGQDVAGDKCQGTCEAGFEYIHDGECFLLNYEESKKGDDACSCDGEADDKEICKVCNKPKPKKPEKEERGQIVININPTNAKRVEEYFASPEGKQAILKILRNVDLRKLTKQTDETCSCDGEADDKEVCSICKKPKRKETEIITEEHVFICAKCKTPYLKLLDKETDGTKVCRWERQCECKEDKQIADSTGEELPADPCSDEDVGFVMVDADAVRKDNETEDFVHGGHHYTFDFIPEPEIWIDERMTDEDIMSLKMDLFVERQMIKYCEATLMQCKEIGVISGKWISHMMDSEMEGGGHHDEMDLHGFVHDGNHFHNRGQTIRWDSQTERYNVHSLLIGELVVSLAKDQKEAFEKDMDEAIKQVAVKYGLREAPPAEPGAEKKKPAIINIVNSPEPRKVVITTEEDRKRAEQDRNKQLSEMLAPVVAQIEEVFKKIPAIIKEEIDRLKGRVK